MHSKPAFTLIETLVAIGIFVLLAAGGTTLYTSWLAISHHSEAIATITELFGEAERNALSSLSGSDWVVEQTSIGTVTLRDTASHSVETVALPSGTTINWNNKTIYTFTRPSGTVDTSGMLTVINGNRQSNITIRKNGTLDVNPTAL